MLTYWPISVIANHSDRHSKLAVSLPVEMLCFNNRPPSHIDSAEIHNTAVTHGDPFTVTTGACK